MNIKCFIKEQLIILSKAVLGIKFRYGFDALAEAHIIQIAPESAYQNNVLLDKAWMSLMDELDTLFPQDHIVVIPNNSSLALKEPEFSV